MIPNNELRLKIIDLEKRIEHLQDLVVEQEIKMNRIIRGEIPIGKR